MGFLRFLAGVLTARRHHCRHLRWHARAREQGGAISNDVPRRAVVESGASIAQERPSRGAALYPPIWFGTGSSNGCCCYPPGRCSVASAWLRLCGPPPPPRQCVRKLKLALLAQGRDAPAVANDVRGAVMTIDRDAADDEYGRRDDEIEHRSPVTPLQVLSSPLVRGGLFSGVVLRRMKPSTRRSMERRTVPPSRMSTPARSAILLADLRKGQRLIDVVLVHRAEADVSAVFGDRRVARSSTGAMTLPNSTQRVSTAWI